MAQVAFEDVMKNLGDVIRNYRKQRGLTQGELSEKIDKPQSTVARLETTIVKDTHLSLIYQVCEALDLNLADVLSEAVSRSKAGQTIPRKDEDGKWEILRERVQLLDKEDKQEVLKILESSLKLTH